MMLLRTLLSILCVSVFLSSRVTADTWSQFRGDTGGGFSSEDDLPQTWSADEGILWQTPLTGRGNSSPVVTRHRVDVTMQTEDKALWVASYESTTGKLLRKTKVGSGQLTASGPTNLYAHRHNAASPTPIADDEHVWAFFGTGLVVCLRAGTGDVVWERDLTADFGAYEITFGMGSSPRLYGDKLYIACMTKGPSYVVALNKMTGEQVWKVSRRLPAADDGPDAYSTPAIYQTSSGPVLLVSGSDHVNSYDLATGRELWQTDGLKINSPYGRIIASPVGASGVIVATSANPPGGGLGRMLGLRYGHDGQPLWNATKSTPDAATPVIVGSDVYTISNNGIGTCLDLKSGRNLWQKRVGKEPFFAAPIAGDGKIYFLNIGGECTVVEAGHEGRILATNTLEGESFYATPAISRGTLFFRSYDRLIAVGGT